MYLFVGFFDEAQLAAKKCRLTGSYFENVKRVFPDYARLHGADIKGCIGFFKTKATGEKPSYALSVGRIEAKEGYISFPFEVDQVLDILSGTLSRSIYKHAIKEDWITKENKFCPNICIVDKETFDLIRKGTSNVRKMSSQSARQDVLKSENNWAEMCALCEPLEGIHTRQGLWDNADELYQLGFACSKLGEPQNGMEQHKSHLVQVKRYRELSITFYRRCIELEPSAYQYVSALAYRHYLNVTELTKPKGRRDGNKNDEIKEAHHWLEKSLAIHPNSIKDNYRKGKIILDKEIDQLKYAGKEWDGQKLNDLEASAVFHLEKVIEVYEALEQRKQAYSRNEYVKTLYTLGKHYMGKVSLDWVDYAIKKIEDTKQNLQISHDDVTLIAKAKDSLTACFQAEMDLRPDDEFNVRDLTKAGNEWVLSPVYKFYRLGVVYLYMYLIKIVTDRADVRTENYGKYAVNFLQTAKAIALEQERRGDGRKKVWYISEKLAWYHILREEYDAAISLIERGRDSYIKNTYAVALMLSERPDKFAEAEAVLKPEVSNKYNLGKSKTIVLLAHTYKQSGNRDGFTALLEREGKNLGYSAQKQIPVWPEGEWHL